MEITANNTQAITSSANILFTDVAIPGNCSILHRNGSGIVTLRGLQNGQCRSRFKVFYNANIAANTAATAISVAIAINGEAVSESTSIVTPAAVSEYTNVSASIYVDVPTGCCAQISVKNTSNQSISTQNANLIVERVA